MYVVQIDAGELRITNAAAIQQLEYQAITLWKSCRVRHLAVKHSIHFFNRRHARQFFGELWSRYQSSGILFHNSILR